MLVCQYKHMPIIITLPKLSSPYVTWLCLTSLKQRLKLYFKKFRHKKEIKKESDQIRSEIPTVRKSHILTHEKKLMCVTYSNNRDILWYDCCRFRYAMIMNILSGNISIINLSPKQSHNLSSVSKIIKIFQYQLFNIRRLCLLR